LMFWPVFQRVTDGDDPEPVPEGGFRVRGTITVDLVIEAVEG